MGLDEWLKKRQHEDGAEKLDLIIKELKETNAHLKRIDYDISIIKNKTHGGNKNEKNI